MSFLLFLFIIVINMNGMICECGVVVKDKSFTFANYGGRTDFLMVFMAYYKRKC